ncbi:MAG: hypothetical protein ABSB75_08665 [Candidatus Limnocylindrales bacterium]
MRARGDHGKRDFRVYKRIGWKAGAWHDVGWWQLELSPAADAAPPEPLPPG